MNQGRRTNMRLPPAHTLDVDTFQGAIKWQCWEQGVTLAELAPLCGLKPGSMRTRMSKTVRGKRALQPWQVTAIATRLGMDETELHRLAARHEGWKV